MRLFLPQTTLEEWALDDKADLEDDKLIVRGEDAAWPLAPAVHFVQCVAGTDQQKLVQKVKTQTQLAALGAEHLSDSVILGETAYEVVPGYVAEIASSAAGKADRRPSSPEADLLAAFILNKMS